MLYPRIDTSDLIQRLEPPAGPCDVVIDTDAYNEIDDQFAIVHALLSDNLNVEAIHAAPFHSVRGRGTTGPADGMEMSYREIINVLDLMSADFGGAVLRGSGNFMSAYEEPVSSPAADDLISRALEDRDGPLYVLALGALTNVASAILTEPEIVRRIVVIPLGGSPHETGSYADFNFTQDVDSVRVVFDSGAAVVHVVGYVVSEMMRTTEAELARYVRGRGDIGDYLYRLYTEWVPDEPARSKPIWDLANGAYLIDPAWTRSRLVPSPLFNDGLRYSFDPSRHPVRVLTRVDRDAVFADFFTKLEEATA